MALYQKIDYRYPDALPRVEKRLPYTSASQAPMTLDAIKAYLEDKGILEEFMPAPCHHEIPSCPVEPMVAVQWGKSQ